MVGLIVHDPTHRGAGYHETCYRETLRCHVRCKTPRRNCTRIEAWILLHGFGALPGSSIPSPEDYFFYLRLPLLERGKD